MALMNLIEMVVILPIVIAVGLALVTPQTVLGYCSQFWRLDPFWGGLAFVPFLNIWITWRIAKSVEAETEQRRLNGAPKIRLWPAILFSVLVAACVLSLRGGDSHAIHVFLVACAEGLVALWWNLFRFVRYMDKMGQVRR